MSNHKPTVESLMRLRAENHNKYSQAVEQLKSESSTNKDMLALYIATATAEINALQHEKQEAKESVEATVTYDYFERNGKKYPVCQFNNFGTRPFSLGSGKIGALVNAAELGFTLKDIQKTLKSM